MAKASPARNSFNAGEYSVLVEGRTDYERYPASMKALLNMVVTPQGPALRRSGTEILTEACYDDKYSTLKPFIYNEDQSLWLEFTDGRVRFVLESGVQTYPAVPVASVESTVPFVIRSATLGAEPGDQVVINGLPGALAFNGRTFNIVSKLGDDYTLDANFPGSAIEYPGMTAARVYHVGLPYTDVEARGIRMLTLEDTVYIYCDGHRPALLRRYGGYDWRYSQRVYVGGPFIDHTGKKMGTLKPDDSGRARNASVTSSTAESGHTNSALLDQSAETWFQVAAPAPASPAQEAYMLFDFGEPIVVDGYKIHRSRDNNIEDADNNRYSATDAAPSDFSLRARVGTSGTWFMLDRRAGHVVYDNGCTPMFNLTNTIAYQQYELNVYKLVGEGNIAARIGEIIFQASTDPAIPYADVVLSGNYSDVNNGQGFLASDVDRLLRLKGADNIWRIARITEVTNATTIRIHYEGEPMFDAQPIIEWQLGYFSDTIGWPTCATFAEDRLWESGMFGAPGIVVASRTGGYDDFTQKSSTNEVLDDGALVVRLNGARTSRVRWLESDERGVLVGTGAGEFVITSSSTSDSAITARSIRARNSTKRGSAYVEPVKSDRQVLFVQRSKRNLREMAYVFEADGYRTPSLSLFASHLTISQFEELAFAEEPYSIMWVRRADGSVIALTYNREHDVIGWHRHDFGGVVTSVSTLPSADNTTDLTAFVIDREVDGETRRFIEKLTPLWDFGMTLDGAHFVDCGKRYTGAPTNQVFDLWFLEGVEVDGLMDGVKFRGLPVTNGVLTLPNNVLASNIVVGRGFSSYGETSRLEAGAADGTSQGKIKRANLVAPFVWDSWGGEIGRYNETDGAYEWEDILYKDDYSTNDRPALATFIGEPVQMPIGYDNRGAIAFRQDDPYPLNVVALYPQLMTQDR